MSSFRPDLDDTKVSSNGARVLVLDAPCQVCRRQLRAGTQAWYDPKRGTVDCLSHHEGATPNPVSNAAHSDSTKVAGASAFEEYETRLQAWQESVHTKWGPFTPVALAFKRPPFEVTRWRQGALGEVHVGRELDKLTRSGCVVFHDRSIPHSKANIDHIVVCSSGVFVVDAKNYRGLIRVEGPRSLPSQQRLMVGAWDRSNLLSTLTWELSKVASAVAGVDPNVPVGAALAFYEGSWPLFPKASCRGVLISSPSKVRKVLASRGPLSASMVEKLASTIDEAFPARA